MISQLLPTKKKVFRWGRVTPPLAALLNIYIHIYILIMTRNNQLERLNECFARFKIGMKSFGLIRLVRYNNLVQLHITILEIIDQL